MKHGSIVTMTIMALALEDSLWAQMLGPENHEKCVLRNESWKQASRCLFQNDSNILSQIGDEHSEQSIVKEALGFSNRQPVAGVAILEVSEFETDVVKRNRFMSILLAHDTFTRSSSADQQGLSTPSSVQQISPPSNNISSTEFPKIIAWERLSDGECLLAWEGRSDRLFQIEYSDDLVNWKLAESNIPTINGIGNWSTITSSSRRFFRVFQDEESQVTPSDPGGGDGITTFGGTISFQYYGTYVDFANITVNLPGNIEPSLITFYIDGKRYANARKSSSGDGSYFVKMPNSTLSFGSHTIHAVIHSNSESTPSLEEPVSSSPEIQRTLNYSFSSGFSSESLPWGLRVTEEEFAPNEITEPGEQALPNITTFKAEIPGGWLGWRLSLYGPEGFTRRWHGRVGLNTPLSLSIPWDGTDENGGSGEAGIYSAQLEAGDSIYGEGFVQVALQKRQYKMLCVMEPSVKTVPNNAWLANYHPAWKGHITSSGNSLDANAAWGPWGKLKSLANVVEELKKPLGSISKSGKWRVHQWASGGPFNDTGAGNPAITFESGGNPFNTYEMGLFLGHGVASSGGAYPGGNLPPQHHMPLLKDRTTGETVWVKSGTHAKYGAAGSNLNWMFLMTCNSLRDQVPHSIYNPMIANGSFPFGPDLHVLGGYTTSIDIEAGMGKLLSEVLVDEPRAGFNTVVKAWEHVWKESSNSKVITRADGTVKAKRTARAVYWPECVNDTIYGAAHESITDPMGAYNLGRLAIMDF
jgi:hypothetical protein